MMEKESHTVEETQKIAHEIVSHILKEHRKRNGALVIALCGELGSGKTSFAQGIARECGISEQVTSPTFVLERIYNIKKGSFTHLVHIDCYRLEEEKEVEVLGWKELAQNPKNLIVVEWAERIKNLLPKDMMEICFEHVDEGKRKITIK